ncbi:MAG: hypothetical protein K2Z81_17035, partial [Cyanobacteria bacterium]|nr:hypothetical protein [Cyanobacteriota bacterium]
MVDPISNYEYSPQAEQNPSAAVYEGLAAACWAPQDTTATNSTATADNASPAERIITSATNNEKPEWKKGEPDRVRSDASAPSREEKDKALEKAKEMFKSDLAANLYEDLVKGNMGHFGLMMHDLRHNYPSGVKGVGMKELQAAVEELNKVLRYPIEIVTGEGEPPEL